MGVPIVIGSQSVMNELGRAATHGASQQLVQGAFGNQMSWQGFAAGAAGSLVGSGIEAGGTSLGMSKGLIDATQIAGSATMGGIMADDFWQGFSTSAIVGAANHAMHHGLSRGDLYKSKGESVKQIAAKHNISVEQLMKWNKWVRFTDGLIHDNVVTGPTVPAGTIVIVSEAGYNMVDNRWMSDKQKVTNKAGAYGLLIGGVLGGAGEVMTGGSTGGAVFGLGTAGGGLTGVLLAEVYTNSSFYWQKMAHRVYYD